MQCGHQQQARQQSCNESVTASVQQTSPLLASNCLQAQRGIHVHCSVIRPFPGYYTHAETLCHCSSSISGFDTSVVLYNLNMVLCHSGARTVGLLMAALHCLLGLWPRHTDLNTCIHCLSHATSSCCTGTCAAQAAAAACGFVLVRTCGGIHARGNHLG